MTHQLLQCMRRRVENQPVSPSGHDLDLAPGALGTGIAYTWNQTTVRAWGPTRASTVTYITPVVGVALGVLILHEAVSWNEPVGGLIVILGILLAQNRVRIGRKASAVGEA